MDKNKNKRSALGKGLGSLLGEAVGSPSVLEEVTSTTSSISHLPIDKVEPNPGQPRKTFDEEALQQLSASIEIEGVLQPIIVNKVAGDENYTIVAGERRWRASKRAGKTHIPAIIKDGTDEELMRIALIENIQRSDLNPIEEAMAYSSLIKDFGLTQDECSKKVGKQRSTVGNALRLLTLPTQLQDDLIEGSLSMGHARALLGLGEQDKILEARNIVVQNNLNVRQTEKMIQGFGEEEIQPKKNQRIEGAKKSSEIDPDLNHLADNIRNHLQTKVRVSGSSAKGKIEISYFSASELERIIGIITN